jgi:hypothetical protein
LATNIFALVPLIDKSIPGPYHVMLTFPKIALVNVMGCKIFRDIRFGRLDPTIVAAEDLSTELHLSTARTLTTNLQFHHQNSSRDSETASGVQYDTKTVIVGIPGLSTFDGNANDGMEGGDRTRHNNGSDSDKHAIAV